MNENKQDQDKEQPCFELALPNDTALDDDGWCLIAPFGEWPKTRRFLDGTQLREQHFVQVMDNAAADALLSKENSFFGRLKRAMVGVPVYREHGDLKDVDRQAVGNDVPKLKIGVVDKIRKGPRGIESHFALDNDGQQAVEDGYKFPSALWYVVPLPNTLSETLSERDRQSSRQSSGQSGEAPIRCRPFKLISVALTRFPNISGVESLANSHASRIPVRRPVRRSFSEGGSLGEGGTHHDPISGVEPLANARPARQSLGEGGSQSQHSSTLPAVASTLRSSTATEDGLAKAGPSLHHSNTNMLKHMLVGWLAARGVALANEATDAQVIEAIQNLNARQAANVTALDNEKSDLSGKIIALENELAPLRHKLAEAQGDFARAAASACAERKGRAQALVDNVILQGRLTVADRAMQVEALQNSKDEAAFLAAAKALGARPRLQGVRLDAESGRVLANQTDPLALAKAEYESTFKDQLQKCGQDPIKAHAAAMKKPGLADKLKPLTKSPNH